MAPRVEKFEAESPMPATAAALFDWHSRPGAFQRLAPPWERMVFLDEIGELSPEVQAKLLRVIETHTVIPVGARDPLPVDVRIVAATNEDLPRMAEQGRFRADLLDRLSFEVITLPPLRVREGDIGVLTDHFGRRMARQVQAYF